MTGSCAERGNLCCDAKGEPGGGGPAKGRVPDAWHRDGRVRSSGEAQ